MSSRTASLQRSIQRHTSSTITEKYVETIIKLAKSHREDKQGFIKACMALARFKGQETFLGELHELLLSGDLKLSGSLDSDGHGSSNDGDHPARSQGVSHGSNKLGRKRIKIDLSFDLDNEEDEGGDDAGVMNISKGTAVATELDIDDDENSDDGIVNPDYARQSIRFKRIDKVKAAKLKKYSVLPTRNAIPNVVTTTTTTTTTDSTLQDPLASGNGLRTSKVEDERGDSLRKPSYQKDNPQRLTNYDPLVFRPLTISTNTNKRRNEAGRHTRKHEEQDVLHSEIQLRSVPLKDRQKWVPSFLQRYDKDRNVSNATLIGTTTENSFQKSMVNPVRNPDSEFCRNARLGSRLVNLTRAMRDRQQKSKQNVQLEGSSLGAVLGVMDSAESLDESSGEIVGQEYKYTKDRATYIPEDIRATRESLPIFKARSKLLNLIRQNQVCIIIGETGSGKTTQLAQYLNEDGYSSQGKAIAVTQPRRIAAMSVAKRVSLEMGVQLGKEVGYNVRFENVSSQATKIKFMTDGILLREVLTDSLLSNYSCIIIDEVHERTVSTDVLLGILKQILQQRNDLKVIITSATMNANKFAAFFGNAPMFTIPGRTYPVQINFTEYPVADYVEAAVTQAVTIHLSNSLSSGDILIFMTGQEDIEVTINAIKEKLLEVYSKKSGVASFNEISDVEIYPLYSALPPELQNRIFRKLDHNKRKIVVATNIAETSLTVDGVRYVIDCGYSKLKVYNPKIGLDSLTITPISRANADQRSGRAGRMAPGVAYRLYTEDNYEDDMYAAPIPEIQRTNLSNTLLLLKSLGVQDILKFPFVDPPAVQTMVASLYELWFIQALDNFGNLTSLGKQMSRFPLQPSLSKTLLLAAHNGCSQEVLSIVSMLSVPQIFLRPKEWEKESDLARSKFFIVESDHLTLLNVYMQWRSNNYSKTWCRKNFLHYRSLVKARDIRDQLLGIMRTFSVPIVSSKSDWSVIRRCFCYGFSHQAAKLSGLGKYVQLRTGMDVKLHPTSALYGLGDLPQYVIYHEFLMTSTEYICCVTTVDPLWLMDSCPILYDIKRFREKDEDQYLLESHHVESEPEEEFEKTGYEVTGKFEAAKNYYDDLDRMLQESYKRRDAFIKKLEEDNAKYLESERASAGSSTSATVASSRGSNGRVSVGFRKRKPFF